MLRLVTDGILRSFADLVYANQQRIYQVWLISPWIGGEDERQDTLFRLIDGIRSVGAGATLITRPPIHAWHVRGIELLRANTGVVVYTCRDLHTKLYLLECNGFRAAVLGSPNLTPRGDRTNRELAIELRTTVEGRDNPIAEVITQLTEYAFYLRGEDDVRLL